MALVMCLYRIDFYGLEFKFEREATQLPILYFTCFLYFFYGHTARLSILVRLGHNQNNALAPSFVVFLIGRSAIKAFR